MIHYRCLTSYRPKTASESVSSTTQIFPFQKNFPRLSPEDAVTRAASDLTEALQKPIPSIPILHLGDKHTTALRQISNIFNTSVPQAPAPPHVQLLRVETPDPPQPQRITQKTATKVPPESAPRQGVREKEKVTMTQGRAPRQPDQTRPHVILDDTDARSPLTHPYNGNICNIPPVHIYKTRARRMQDHDLMANHVATVQPLNTPEMAIPAYSINKTGEEWAHTNKTTGDMKIHPVQLNAVICPDTGKLQEYRHLLKGPNKPKWKRKFANKI